VAGIRLADSGPGKPDARTPGLPCDSYMFV
jgi:hypothetical protein